MKRSVRWALVAGALSGSALSGQPRDVPIVRVTVSTGDLEEAVRWYIDAIGFDVEHRGPTDEGGREARLSMGRAVLLLRTDAGRRSAGPTNLIKIGLLVPRRRLAIIERRIASASSASLLVPVDSLPQAPHLDPWPDVHVLARDPDGTLVQLFSRSDDVAEARWMLAAATVQDLEHAVEWYSRSGGFTELGRPETGDRRSLLRRGDFHLEIGEFGGGTTDAQGVTRLQLGESPECADVETPEAYTLRLCGSS